MTTTQMTQTQQSLAERFEGRVTVEAGAWSGNVRPWRGEVLVDGIRRYRSGGCVTQGRALAAARAHVGLAMHRAAECLDRMHGEAIIEDRRRSAGEPAVVYMNDQPKHVREFYAKSYMVREDLVARAHDEALAEDVQRSAQAASASNMPGDPGYEEGFPAPDARTVNGELWESAATRGLVVRDVEATAGHARTHVTLRQAVERVESRRKVLRGVDDPWLVGIIARWAVAIAETLAPLHAEAIVEDAARCARDTFTVERGEMPFGARLHVTRMGDGGVRVEVSEQRGARRGRTISYEFTTDGIARALRACEASGQGFCTSGPARLSLLDHVVKGEALTMVLVSVTREASTGSGRVVTRRFGRSFVTEAAHAALRQALSPKPAKLTTGPFEGPFVAEAADEQAVRGALNWHLFEVREGVRRFVGTFVAADTTPEQRAAAEAHAALFASAPALREACAGFVGVLKTMDRSYRPDQVWALLDKWAVVAEAALGWGGPTAATDAATTSN